MTIGGRKADFSLGIVLELRRENGSGAMESLIEPRGGIELHFGWGAVHSLRQSIGASRVAC